VPDRSVQSKPPNEARRPSSASSETLAERELIETPDGEKRETSGEQKEADLEKHERTDERPGDALGQRPTLTQRLSKRISKKKTEKDHHDEYEIILQGNEHLDPHNWSEPYRWWLTVLVGFMVLNATFASSAPSNLIPSIIQYFGVSEEVGILTISLFVAGYCVGPLLWGDEIIVLLLGELTDSCRAVERKIWPPSNLLGFLRPLCWLSSWMRLEPEYWSSLGLPASRRRFC
jgi:hypothetical protein